MVLMQKPSVIKSPSGRMPKTVPRWDVMCIEGCGGGKVVSWLPWKFLGYKNIQAKELGKETLEGPTRQGERPTPLAAPCTLVDASLHLRLHLQVSWFASGPRKIIAKVSFHLDSVWSKNSYNNIAIMLIIHRFFCQTFYRILLLSNENNFPFHYFHERHYKDE